MQISLHPTEASKALNKSLVIIIPVYNEAANIAAVVNEWRKTLQDIEHQFLLINDGSKDDTQTILEALERQFPEEFVIIDKPNSGHGRTCRLGYDAAVASNAVEWILQIDSDGQCESVFFPDFWDKRLNADCVFGKRIKRDDGFARTVTSKICKFVTTVLGGTDMGDPNVPYRLMRKEVLANALQQIPPSFNIHNVALTFILKQNPAVKFLYVPIGFPKRQGGDNSINLLNVAHWGVDMLLELNKLKPKLRRN